MKSKIIKFLFISIIAFVFVPSLTFAYTSPTTFGFEWVGGFSTDPDVAIGESQFSLEVSTENGDKVGFKFLNYVGDPASICDVYFDDSNPPFIKWPPAGDADITSSSGVSFSEGASPGHLPGGGDFGKDPDFSADSDSGGTSANGVNQSGEWLKIAFKLDDNYATPPSVYDQLVDAITDGSFRVGIHAQAMGSNGNSLSFVTGGGGGFEPGPTPIPEPTTMLLLGTGLVGIAGTSRRRKKLQK